MMNEIRKNGRKDRLESERKIRQTGEILNKITKRKYNYEVILIIILS